MQNVNVIVTEAVILCGGLGTRLRSVVDDRPKSMALVNDRPFLDYLLQQCESMGVQRVVLAVGYFSECITSYIDNHTYSLDIVLSHEQTPLGTGGSLWQARRLLKSTCFFVLNGDSFFDFSFSLLSSFHLTHGGMMSMSLLSVSCPSRYGTVLLHSDHHVISFDEKATHPRSHFINAGVLLISQDIFDYYRPAQDVFSLERDVFPLLVSNHFIYGLPLPSQTPFIDIGTPEDLVKAKDVL